MPPWRERWCPTSRRAFAVRSSRVSRPPLVRDAEHRSREATCGSRDRNHTAAENAIREIATAAAKARQPPVPTKSAGNRQATRRRLRDAATARSSPPYTTAPLTRPLSASSHATSMLDSAAPAHWFTATARTSTRRIFPRPRTRCIFGACWPAHSAAEPPATGHVRSFLDWSSRIGSALLAEQTKRPPSRRASRSSHRPESGNPFPGRGPVRRSTPRSGRTGRDEPHDRRGPLRIGARYRWR